MLRRRTPAPSALKKARDRSGMRRTLARRIRLRARRLSRVTAGDDCGPEPEAPLAGHAQTVPDDGSAVGIVPRLLAAEAQRLVTGLGELLEGLGLVHE